MQMSFKKKSYCVLQRGARHNYLIPKYFAMNNLLASFYTDFHSSHFIFKLFKFIPNIFLTKRLKRISNRKLPKEIPINLVNDNFYNIFNLDQLSVSKELFTRIKSDNFGNANSIYTNLINEDIEFLIEAKKKGLFIVYEVIINPNINQIYENEIRKYPLLEAKKKEKKQTYNAIDRDLIKLNLADKILVPSEYIFKEVIKKGIAKNKINIIEQSISNEKLLEIKTNPQKGKILFVGQISIMKGIHYFAEACRILEKKNIFYEFLAVGKSSLNIRNPLLKGPKYLGYLSFEELINIYSSSDIFVLPSLSDAFPISHLEAMAFGLPVILTNSCGNIVEDGKSGYIINPKDSNKLADKIEEIVENRSLRKKFSENARKKVKNYGVEQFYKKLDKALN